MKVLALGGSVIKNHRNSLAELAEPASRYDVVVTGAGPLAEYIEYSEANESLKDLIGIQATRLHAQALSVEMENSNTQIPENFQDIVDLTEIYGTVVAGGMSPGYSTDAVAAIVAELLEADLYIASDVEGVYDENPDEEGAELLEEVSVGKLHDIIEGNSKAGGYELLDRTALEIIERSEINSKIFRGINPRNLEKPENIGTRILR